MNRTLKDELEIQARQGSQRLSIALNLILFGLVAPHCDCDLLFVVIFYEPFKQITPLSCSVFTWDNWQPIFNIKGVMIESMLLVDDMCSFDLLAIGQ